MSPSDNDELVDHLRRCAEQARVGGARRDAGALERAAAALQTFPVIVRDRRTARQVPGVGAVALRYLERFSTEFATDTAPCGTRKKDMISTGPVTDRQRTGRGEASSAATVETVLSGSRIGPTPEHGVTSARNVSSLDRLHESSSECPAAARTYRPRRGSAAAALLIGLWELGGGPCTKSEIVNAAQRYTMVPLVRLHRGWNTYRQRQVPNTSSTASFSLYDGWSTMNGTLLCHDLVSYNRTRPRKYALTCTGRELAESLALESQVHPSDRLFAPSSEIATSDRADARECRHKTSPCGSPAMHCSIQSGDDLRAVAPLTCRASPSATSSNEALVSVKAFQIRLVIDYREKPEFQTLLRQLDVAFWVRALPAGDALWVATTESTVSSTASNATTTALDEQAYVLNVLVERKLVPDLIASIRDQRYRMQKARMRQSGLERLVYLIEGDALLSQSALPAERTRLEQTIQNAQLRTKLRDGFHVVRVANAVVTAHWYQHMTSQFQRRLAADDRSMLVASSDASTPWLTLGAWRRHIQRREQILPIRAILCRQLQALPGIRERIALAVLQCTGATSSHELYEWFQQHASAAAAAAKLTAESKLRRENGMRPIPSTVSALLWQLFT
ncbi:Crossover junction endonuclease mus81 [Cyanidiococcus yangmingshanensis]|uniref:Crossover junction endonuclease MUS81 n=1 Tax=Cyanidiococcus yangmingshanensis TaxID=2690220 RepID=A0A7J7IGA7_9RHOD|nr:Crossover junction endonuclease mus81 [Cyanidiococcus yangmingshanensis]